MIKLKFSKNAGIEDVKTKRKSQKTLHVFQLRSYSTPIKLEM